MPMVYWGTAGTATVELKFRNNRGELVTKTLQGCFVKKEANVKPFVERYIDASADRNKYKRSKYLFYCCVSDFREVVTAAVISYEVPSKSGLSAPKQKTKTCTVNRPLIITFDGHFFLCCDSEDLIRNGFLAEYSKEVRVKQALGTRNEFCGLGIDANYLVFISFKTQKLQNLIYEVNDQGVFNKLLETGPLLLDDNKTIVARYRKLPEENQIIETNIFGNQGEPEGIPPDDPEDPAPAAFPPDPQESNHQLDAATVTVKFNHLMTEAKGCLEDYINRGDGTLENLKDHFRRLLPDDQRTSASDVKELLDALEEHGVITSKDVHVLKVVAEEIQLRGLMKIIQKFEADCLNKVEKPFLGIHLKTVAFVLGMPFFMGVNLVYIFQRNPEILHTFWKLGAELLQVYIGSVAFVLKVQSISSLRQLWKSYKDGSLKENLKHAFNQMEELKALSKGEEIDLEVTIDEREYREVLRDLIQLKTKVTDWIPGVSQTKLPYQAIAGDEEGARLIKENFDRQSPRISQLRSAAELVTGDVDGARKTQEAFVRNVSDEDVEEDITIVPVPDRNLVGLVIGKHGRTIDRLMKETFTYIRYEKESNVFVIQGEAAENRYAAKLKVKEIISNGLKTQTDKFKKCCRFPFVDLNRHGFVLEALQHDVTRGHGPAFKVVLKDLSIRDPSESRTTDYSNFTSQMINVLQSIYEESQEDVINNIWSHFGHIHLSNVSNDEAAIEFDAQELLSHVKWDNASNATKWRTKFVGGIVDGTETHDLFGWMASRPEKGFPFIRYEFVYFTPSCRMIRVKIFLAIDVTSNQVTYRNFPNCEPVANLIKSSDTNPYFYLCGSTVKRAMVDVFQPAEGLDFRLIIDSGQKFQTDGVDDNEVDTLFNYIHDNMNVKPKLGLELPQENLPADFDLCYVRVSERRTYPFTSEDDEQFTVKLSYENTVNRPNGTSETTMDVHLQYDSWDRMLEDGSWTPQKVVDKIPSFMRCASSLAKILKMPGTTPAEIFARGPKAQEAYEAALKSGTTKYCRVPVVLVGQSGAGKTSLLRSLRRQEFNPHEDSTEGVRIHRSIAEAEADLWHEDVAFESFFVDCIARAVAENLSSSFDDSLELRSVQGVEEETPFQDQVDDEVDQISASHGHLEESNKSLDGEGRKTENEYVTANEDESVNENQSTLSDPVLFEERTKVSPIPTAASEMATSILQNPDMEETQECVHLVTLDFAGQPVYNATHPIFLPKKAIYILVNSLENAVHAKATPVVRHGSLERKIDDRCPMTNMDHLEFWLSYVASLWTSDGVQVIDDNALALLRTGNKAPKTEQKPTTKEAMLPKRLPPVFLVCTHADVPFEGKDATKMTREIFSHLKNENEASGGNHIVHGLYAVNNTVSGKIEEKAVEELRANIYQIARSLPYVNEVVPIRWLQFEKKLSDLATSENKKYISLEQGQNVAMQCQIATNTNLDEFNTVLNYLHDLKVIIYFEDTKIIIIDIQWLLDMIVKVITVQPVEKWDDHYEEQWKRLENEGILERALIDHVWEYETIANSLLMIMEKFSLLCCWKRLDAQDIFLVPSMLMNSDAKEADELLSDVKTSNTLVVRFKSAHLPLGIFPRLLVIIAKMWNEKRPDSPQPKFFHNVCRFYDVGDVKDTGKSFDLVVTSDIKTISFSVINEQGIMGLPSGDLCRFIVDFLRKTLQTMRANFPWMKNADYEFGIRCPNCYPSSEPCEYHSVIGCTRDACVHFITENELRTNQIRCYKNPTSKSTFFDKEVYCDWFDVVSRDDQQETNPTNVVGEVIRRRLAIHNAPSTSEVSIGSEIVTYAAEGRDLSVPEITPLTKAEFNKLLAELEPYKTSLRDPPRETIEMCRNVCRKLKGVQRPKLIEKLRDYVPSGMTGPLMEENTPYSHLDAKTKQNLTRELCGQEMLKRLLDKFGQSKFFDYYNGHKNPVEALFEEQSKKIHLTVGALYDVLINCEANAIADDHL